jgi:protein Mpv17
MVKVGLDQVFFAPTILALFMGGISVLEGRNLTEIKQKFENSYYNGLMNSYRYWPFVNMFTFAIIPVHYRPIVGSCFGIGWNSYLSHMNQKSGNALHSTQHTHTAAATSSLAATTTKLSS